MSKPFHLRPMPYVFLILAMLVRFAYLMLLGGFKMYKDKDPAVSNSPVYYVDFEPLHVVATPLEES